MEGKEESKDSASNGLPSNHGLRKIAHRLVPRPEDEEAADAWRAGSASGDGGRGGMSNHLRSHQHLKMRFISSCFVCGDEGGRGCMMNDAGGLSGRRAG